MAIKRIMNKNELIRDFVDFYNSDKVTTDKLKYVDMHSVMDELGKYIEKKVSTLDADESIQLGSFLKIYTIKRKEKTYKNPMTGEEVFKEEGKTLKAKLMPVVIRAFQDSDKKE